MSLKYSFPSSTLLPLFVLGSLIQTKYYKENGYSYYQGAAQELGNPI